MDILEEKDKITFDNNIKKLINDLKFKKFPIKLVGSSSLKSQKYFSDYDLLSNIEREFDSDIAFREFDRILNKVLENPNYYFIELKIQTLRGIKGRWFPNGKFEYKDFLKYWENVDFVKLDLIVYTDNNRLVEVSIIYKFSKKKLTKDEYIKSINTDIKDLIKEGKYYKVLKRLFSIAKLNKDKVKLKYLTTIFNSNMGSLYQIISNLEAMKKLKEHYNDKITNKKIEINLKDINVKPDMKLIDNTLVSMYDLLNKNAKKIYKEIK